MSDVVQGQQGQQNQQSRAVESVAQIGVVNTTKITHASQLFVPALQTGQQLHTPLDTLGRLAMTMQIRSEGFSSNILVAQQNLQLVSARETHLPVGSATIPARFARMIETV